MKSYIENEKSYKSIKLLEDCTLYQFKIEDLKSLFEKDLYIVNWGQKLAEQELIKTEERLISRQVPYLQENIQKAYGLQQRHLN